MLLNQLIDRLDFATHALLCISNCENRFANSVYDAVAILLGYHVALLFLNLSAIIDVLLPSEEEDPT